MPGPVPKRSEERLGHANGKLSENPISRGELRPVKWPSADRSWSKRAKQLWNSVKVSGQSDYFQQSDIARIAFLMDQVTYYENAKSKSAMMFQTICSEMTTLLFSEGDRRRVRIELAKPDSSVEDAQLVAIKGYKDALGKPKGK